MAVLLLLVLLLAIPAAPTLAATVYVTDRVVAELHAAPGDAEPIAKLPTGTPLEQVASKGDRVQVRTSDGKVGWLPVKLVQKEKPAQLLLIALSERQERTEAQLTVAQAKLRVLQSRGVAQAVNRWHNGWWYPLSLAAALVVGFLLGIAWLDHRNRERHGGFRL